MPKRQTGSRSLRKKGVLLDYARRETISLTVPPLLEEKPPVLKTVVETTEINCRPPCDDEAAPGESMVEARSLAVALEPPTETIKEPQRFGAYELFFEIGKDALSTTHIAKNASLEGFLALRIFNEKITDSSQVRSIQKAALKAAELTHPNHVCVYDNGIGENLAPYVVTEWIEGETLADLFHRKTRLDIASFLNIFNQVSDVLAEAHSRRLFHGNLSPQKIILATNEIEADVVKLIDFGMPVDPVQNAFYMSPEQCLDKDRVDARSDIYSLGCIMYESLVGRPPSLGSQTSANSVDFLHELANQYSKESQEHNALKLLDCIIKRCLQKKPSKRFTSVRELINALSLVADCFNHPGSKKLPRQAEKLLLFRFLDLFDKKITAALTAYLLLGLFATKYIGEIQLQKFIDEAQTARPVSYSQTESNWMAAIKQAESMGKPPSLLAELHWELADTYQMQAVSPLSNANRNNLAKDAITQYELAYEYYKRGPHYKSYALSLLESMGQLWSGIGDNELQVERRDLSLLQLRNLWNSGNYSACAREAAAYSSKFFDAEINDYAFRSNMELANSLPPQKALTYFARAAYYYPDQSKENPGYVGLNKSLEKLRLIWQLSDTHMHYAGTAMLSGDEAAASGFMQPDYTNGEYQSFYDLLNRYSGLRRSVYGHVEGDPNKQKAIKPLESELEICLKAYGEHGDMLIPILSRLAECYRLSGENQKSITAYEKLLSIAPQGGPEYNREMLAYVDLLSQSGQGKRVPNILEKHLHKQGALDTNNPLLIRLIESYNAEHMSQQAQDALAELLETPKAVKFDPRYQFVDGSSIKPLAEGSLFSEGERQELQKSRGLDPFADAARQPPTKDSPNANSAGDANF